MLTDAKLRNAKKQAKPYKLSDSGQLYLYVSTSGARLWRMNYRWQGKQKTLAIGAYPKMSLADARKARDAAKDLLEQGRDPSVAKRATKAERLAEADHTFEKVARRWHEVAKADWSEQHAEQVLDSLVDNVFPEIGKIPITDLKAPRILEVLQKVENRGAIETAHRIRQRLSGVFQFAGSAGIIDEDKNPAAVVKGAMKKKRPNSKQPALRSLGEARELMKVVEATPATATVKLASRLLAITASRPGALRRAEPGEFEGLDGDNPVWRIPATKMKLTAARKDDETNEFIIPLTPQAVEVVKAALRLNPRAAYLFPSHRSLHKPMSENAIGYRYNDLGYKGRHVPHGWRSTFSTIMNEYAEREGKEGDRQIIDLMLAHVPKDEIEGAYNRARYWPRRRELAEIWADMLLKDLPPAEDMLGKPTR